MISPLINLVPRISFYFHSLLKIRGVEKLPGLTEGRLTGFASGTSISRGGPCSGCSISTLGRRGGHWHIRLVLIRTRSRMPGNQDYDAAVEL